jgi:Rap1a immunity proteins
MKIFDMKILRLTLLVAAPFMAVADDAFLPNSNAFVSGNKLYDWCTATDGSFDKGACYGYIQAVADVANGLKSVDVCMPSSVTVRESIDVVYIYLRDKPAERHFLAYGTVIAALAAAFPCPKAPPPAAPAH